MATLTRLQVQDRNRQTLLDVARTVFLRDGYGAASVAAIAAAAGFTTGIVYSGFGSKADLAMEVATELQHEQIRDLGDHIGSSEHRVLVQQARAWAVAAVQSGWVRFELELLVDCLGEPRLAAAQAERQRDAVQQIGRLLATLLPAVDDDQIEVLATTMLDYSIGMAVRHVTNPEATPERFLSMIEPIIVATLEQQG